MKGTAMEHYAGIDVSLKESSVCVVDAAGKLVREVKVASEPEALIQYFAEIGLPMARIGLEAGPLSQWLHTALVAAGRDVVLLETRHVKAALSAMTVKTDRKDARGIAQLLRMGWYRPVHAKSSVAQDTRALLVGRKLLQGKLLDVELSIRGILRGYGLKVGEVSRGRFEARIQELIAGHATLSTVIGGMLAARTTLWNEFTKLHREMLKIARADKVCQRLMSTPGVGALVALTYRSAVDDPTRFGKSSTSGRLLRAHSKEIPIRRNRQGRRRHQGRRREGANRAFRGGSYPADTGDALFQSQALGARCRTTSRHEARQGRSRPQAGCYSASHVDGRDRLPLELGALGGLREDKEIGAARSRPASTEVPSPGRELGKVVCSAVIALAYHAS